MQIEVLIEECAELIKVLQKLKRMNMGTPNANVTCADVISEGVDVEIMIEMLKHVFPNRSLWQSIRIAKLNRLEKRL